MSDFVKPKTEYVHDKDYIEKLVNINLQKDLHGNEEICQHCHGTGIVPVNNPYGLRNDLDKSVYFPYTHQSLTFCPNCFNGIVHRCELCGGIIKRGYTRHDCEQQRELERKQFDEKRKEELQKADLAPQEVLEESEFYYSDDYGYSNGYFSDWDEFFDYWREEHEPSDKKPEFVWATEPVKMSIDADNIIENATEELYEDACDNVSSEKRKELQDFLDKWCDTCGVGLTYYESKYKVKIPWEDYNE